MGNERILYKDVNPDEVAKQLRLVNRYITDNTFFRDTGLNITKEGDAVPENNGVPRMFIIRDGQVRTFEEEGISVGSRAFWQTAAKGEVFVYPAGEKHPVQMQLKDPTGYSDVDVKFSKPLDPENNPDVEMPGPVPRKPRWYHRWFSFGGNRRLCQTYDTYMAKKKQLTDKVKAISGTIDQTFGSKRTEEALNAEKEENAALKADFAAKKADKEAKELLNKAQINIGAVENGVTNAVRMYGPVPEKVPELVKKGSGNLKGRIYTEEQFAKLKPIDIKGLNVGGTQITDREFASLALCAGSDPKIGVEAQKVAKDPASAIQTIKDDGFTQEEAEEMVTDSIREMYGCSLMRLRADTGNFFEPAVEPARQKAKDALIAYQNGDKGPLAEIMARTALSIGNEGASHMTLNDSPIFSQNAMACTAINMMERDPELKDLAKQKYEEHENEFFGRHPELSKNFIRTSFDDQLKTIRQMDKMSELNQKNLNARKTLLDARVNKTGLTAKEKHDCIRDILLYETAKYRYAADVNMSMHDEPNMWNKNYQAINDHVKKLPKDPNARGAAAKKGSSAPVTADAIMHGALVPRTVPKPGMLDILDDPKKMAQMEKAVDNLIEKDGLANAGIDQIVGKLLDDNPSHHKDYEADSLMNKIVMANARNVKAPVNDQPQMQKQGRAAGEPVAKEEIAPQIVI